MGKMELIMQHVRVRALIIGSVFKELGNPLELVMVPDRTSNFIFHSHLLTMAIQVGSFSHNAIRVHS